MKYPSRARPVLETLEDRRLLSLTITPHLITTPATALAQSIVVQNTGVNLSNATFVGVNGQAGTYSDFNFSIGKASLSIPDGIMLTSGLALSALGPNDTGSDSNDLGTLGDTDLDSLVNAQTFDANSLTIHFATDASVRSILFDFIFASEEFAEFVGTPFNDAFAAYLDGVQVSFDTFAQPITVNNNFFRIDNNIVGFDIQYDGLTPRIRTQAPLNPNVALHTLKFVIADTTDRIYDSGVFLTRLQGSPVVVTSPTTDLPTPGKVQFEFPAFIFPENSGDVALNVVRTDGNSGQVLVNYAITGGTASPGSDFILQSQGTLVFEDGQSSIAIPLTIIDDILAEGDESFTIVLSDPSDGALGEVSTTTVTILDDESLFTLDATSYRVREDGGAASVRVLRLGATTGAATVRISTSDQTAQAGLDYTAVNQVLSFAPGETSQTVLIPVLRDALVDEPTETLVVSLSEPAGAGTVLVGLRPSAQVQIINVDTVPPQVSGLELSGNGRRITAIHVIFDEQVMFAPAVSNYVLSFRSNEKRFGAATLRPAPIISSVYDAATRTVTLVPKRALPHNRLFHLNIAPALSDLSRNLLDGNGDGEGGDGVSFLFGRGTNLLYVDRDGEKVKFSLRGKGIMELFRRADGEGQTLRLIDTVPGVTKLSGILRTAPGTDGITTLQSISGLSGVINLITDSRFVIDELLP